MCRCTARTVSSFSFLLCCFLYECCLSCHVVVATVVDVDAISVGGVPIVFIVIVSVVVVEIPMQLLSALMSVRMRVNDSGMSVDQQILSVEFSRSGPLKRTSNQLVPNPLRTSAQFPVRTGARLISGPTHVATGQLGLDIPRAHICSHGNDYHGVIIIRVI